MSVNFHPSMAPITGYRVCDVTGGRSETIHRTHAEAGAEFSRLREEGTLLPGCTDEFYGPEGMYIDALTADNGADRDVEVSVSNTNAALILEALGLLPDDVSFDDVCCGSMDAGDLLGRALMALALAPEDEGMPAYEMVGSGAPMIQCGRHPGYLQDRLNQIQELARWCLRHRRDVEWS